MKLVTDTTIENYDDMAVIVRDFYTKNSFTAETKVIIDSLIALISDEYNLDWNVSMENRNALSTLDFFIEDNKGNHHGMELCVHDIDIDIDGIHYPLSYDDSTLIEKVTEKLVRISFITL